MAYNFVTGVRKLFFSLVILVSLGFLWFRADSGQLPGIRNQEKQVQEKQEILRFAVVTDSENDNENLKKALVSAKSQNVGFVIGLGDWTGLGLVDDLIAAKSVFDESGLEYYVTAGDRDLWASRDAGIAALNNFNTVFGKATHTIIKNGVEIFILNNSDIYTGISSDDWQELNSKLKAPALPAGRPNSKLTFVFAHKTPFHPQSAHVMGADSEEVAVQAREFLKLMEDARVDGFFSGDLHFFAQFQSPQNAVKITTIGAVAAERNFQGPRFAIVTVFDDYGWEVEDREIK